MLSLININTGRTRRIKETKSIKSISTGGLVQDRILKAVIAITEEEARKNLFLNTTLNTRNVGSNCKLSGLLENLHRKKNLRKSWGQI